MNPTNADIFSHKLPLNNPLLQTADLLRALGPFEPNPVIAIALSGGPDSMALSLLAHDWAQAHDGRIITLTVDHALRPESRAEAEQVAQWIAARGIEHHILTPEHTVAGNNRMQAARQWRYDALADFCRKNDVLHCLLAHHADDQNETALLNQMRGRTADGESGMAQIRLYRGVRFLRPLLNWSKNDLEQYAHAHSAKWINDPSNTRTEFARVRVRQQLVADSLLRTTMAQTIAQERSERHAREHALAEAALACATIYPAGYATLDRPAWMALDQTIAALLLANTLRCISGSTHRARGHEILALTEALRTDSNHKRSLQHCLITWHDGEIKIVRELARVADAVMLGGQGNLQWDKRFDITYTIPPGQSYQLGALGARGRKILKNLGISAAAALPLATPALWHLDELVMVPHMAWGNAKPLPGLTLGIGFAPAKPLAATPFW